MRTVTIQKVVCYSLMALLALIILPAYSAKCKIMFLGDSVTEALDTKQCFRFYLWQKLKEEGYTVLDKGNTWGTETAEVDVDFVGDLYGTWGQKNFASGWDTDHASYWGALVEEIVKGGLPKGRKGNITDWADKYKPDMTLIHLGTNDQRIKQSAQSTLDDFDKIINTLRKANPNAVILVAKIVPSKNSGHRELFQSLNDKLDAWGQELNTPNSPVVIVDQWKNFEAGKHLKDTYHTNVEGAKLMSDVWWASLKPFLNKAAIYSRKGGGDGFYGNFGVTIRALEDHLELTGLSNGTNLILRNLDGTVLFRGKSESGSFFSISTQSLPASLSILEIRNTRFLKLFKVRVN